MSTNNDSLLQRVQSSFQRLTTVAADLNAVSDDLGKAVNALDISLKKLNLGIASWHKFDGDENMRSGDYWQKSIGYAKVGPTWGIALSKESGNYHAPPECCSDEKWLFNDAPRQLRVEAVQHIPAMMEGLIKTAEEVVESVRLTTNEAKGLAAAIAPWASA